MSAQRIWGAVIRVLGVAFLGTAIFRVGVVAYGGGGTPAPPWPYDGAANVDPNGLVLYWWTVLNAKSYDVYLGEAADSLVLQGSATQPQWAIKPTPARGKLYYWRTVARANGAILATGPLRRFTISPPLPTDAALVAWYAFDEGSGGISRNLSGNGPDAQVEQMTWGNAAASGLDGASVQSDGAGWAHFQIPATAQPPDRLMLAGWFRIRPQNESVALWSLGSGAGSYVSFVTHPADGGSPLIEVMGAGLSQPIRSQAKDPLPPDRWTHLAVLMDGQAQEAAVYEDGALVWTAKGLTGLANILRQAREVFLGASFVTDPCLRGGIDDVRLYTRLLDAQEITRTMFGHPDSPYEPGPRQWAQVHSSVPARLQWQGAATAIKYNLYAGVDSQSPSLVARDLTTTEYLLQPAPASGQTLYWQVEAVLANGFVRGPVWQYSVTSQSLADAIAQATPWWADYTKYYCQIAPDISLTDINGEGHRLRDYRSGPLLVVVWAPWCSNCRAEMTELSSLQNAVSGDKVALLTITDESNQALLSDFLAGRSDITFPVCVTKVSSLPAPFSSVLHFPSIFYLAPDGLIELGTVGLVPRAKIEEIIAAAWPQN